MRGQDRNGNRDGFGNRNGDRNRNRFRNRNGDRRRSGAGKRCSDRARQIDPCCDGGLGCGLTCGKGRLAVRHSDKGRWSRCFRYAGGIEDDILQRAQDAIDVLGLIHEQRHVSIRQHGVVQVQLGHGQLCRDADRVAFATRVPEALHKALPQKAKLSDGVGLFFGLTRRHDGPGFAWAVGLPLKQPALFDGLRRYVVKRSGLVGLATPP